MRHGFSPWVRKIPWRRSSSMVAWEILWTEKPGRLQSMGLQRVRHDLAAKQPPPPRYRSVCLAYNDRTLVGFPDDSV